MLGLRGPGCLLWDSAGEKEHPLCACDLIGTGGSGHRQALSLRQGGVREKRLGWADTKGVYRQKVVFRKDSVETWSPSTVAMMKVNTMPSGSSDICICKSIKRQHL